MTSYNNYSIEFHDEDYDDYNIESHAQIIPPDTPDKDADNLRAHLEYCFTHPCEGKVAVYEENNLKFFVFEFGAIYLFNKVHGYSEVKNIKNYINTTKEDFMERAMKPVRKISKKKNNQKNR